MAINFEGTEHMQGISQIGISTLDTRDLPYASSLVQNTIRTQLYCVSKRSKHARLDKKTRKIFTFSQVNWITKQEVVETLAAIFKECNTYPNLEDVTSNPRNVVLVGHGLANELRNMQMLGFRPET